MKYASIIISHYSLVDDFGELERIPQAQRMIRSQLLRECLTSLKENTDYPAEVIVIDNGGNPDDSDYLLQLTRDGLINTLIRNKNNMGFAFAWNQGARLATGNYLCFTCNDILFKPKWLSTCIGLLEQYPNRRLIASPFMEGSKQSVKFTKEILDGNKVSTLAGSNCLILNRQTYLDVGEFPHHRVGGSIWHRRMVRMGYMVIIPPEDLISHPGYRYGINFVQQFPVNKYLLDGRKENFNYTYENPHKDYYYGFQNQAGIPIQEGYLEHRNKIEEIAINKFKKEICQKQS